MYLQQKIYVGNKALMNSVPRFKSAATMIITAFIICAAYVPAMGSSLYTTPPDHSGDPCTMLVLFYIQDGEVHKSFHSMEVLAQQPEIIVKGYVAGIVALSELETEISLNGKRMRNISLKEEEPGNFFLVPPGKSPSSRLFTLDAAELRRAGEYQVKFYDRDGDTRGYTFFPKIFGDAVSPDDRFAIDIRENGHALTVMVHQNGYRALPADAGNHGHAFRFRYIGDRSDYYDIGRQDFRDRIDAIARGISEIYDVFAPGVVRNVNLVDCEGIRNALTRKGENDIWFFIETLRDEPVSELSVIARHELLHLIVDRYGFTGSPIVRKIFADLKGYGDLSTERFLIVARGRLHQQEENSVPHHLMFEFINEKNFFPRSKGGHSQDDLDEFSTSFLHTLMYPERLVKNLEEPLFPGNGRSSYRLGPEEQKEVLEYYIRIINAFIQSARRSGDGGGMETFLESRRMAIQQILNDSGSPNLVFNQ
jgi:hypothetical protein